MDELKSQGKSFEISKGEVWQAYERVKANQGAPGVDEQSLGLFEADLKNNLFKVWNRMSSGSYFPPPVKAVEIDKSDGGVRVLGVPTIADRIAQTVAAKRLESKVESIFHPDSYGYRPNRSAVDAVEQCKRRCWKYDWVIDLDVAKFFDTVPWHLVVKAVEAHMAADGPERWVLLYVKRWLAAPIQLPDGTMQMRDRGTPQGSSISPVLANLFMHYAFDRWLTEHHPMVKFERYADDAVIHCATRHQAERVLAAVANRMVEVGLRLHPDKTKLVYCKDWKRRGTHQYTAFTFLGFTFRARAARGKNGTLFTGFLPAISDQALKRLGKTVRSWRLHRRTSQTWAELARAINPIIAGWMQYYGRFYRSELYPLLKRINTYLMRWIRKKFKRLRTWKKAKAYWERITHQYPRAFAHWKWIAYSW